MVILVLENPEPDNPLRKDVDVEFRVLVKGATGEETELIGEVLRLLCEEIRPGTVRHAFMMDSSEADNAK